MTLSVAALSLLALGAGLVAGCRAVGAGAGDEGRLARERWGSVDGREVELFTLRNARGTTLRLSSYGATITALRLPASDGTVADVVLGFDSLAGYLGEHPYFGCVAGRYANRIAGARFELDGREVELAANDGRNHLHGGERGFGRFVWDASASLTPEGPAVRFARTSPDGEEGYPGALAAAVTYTLTDENVLRIEMQATTTAPTVVNLAQHTYWNLAGHASGTIEDHVLRFWAERYVPVDGELIPTGELAPVAGTPFDFRAPRPIGAALRSVGAGGALPAGYDHDLVIDGPPGTLRPVCRLVERASGRTLEVWSDQPGCQFYTGNFLDGTLTGKDGAVYRQYQGLCLETQKHPDSVHRPEWPSPVLVPGETYRHRMELVFGTAPRR